MARNKVSTTIYLERHQAAAMKLLKLALRRTEASLHREGVNAVIERHREKLESFLESNPRTRDKLFDLIDAEQEKASLAGHAAMQRALEEQQVWDKIADLQRVAGDLGDDDE